MLSFNNPNGNRPNLPNGPLPSEVEKPKPHNYINFSSKIPTRNNAYKLKRSSIQTDTNSFSIGKHPKYKDIPSYTIFNLFIPCYCLWCKV